MATPTPPPPPGLADAGLCETPEQPWLSVTAGEVLRRVTLTDPLALCNDGSPGIFYVSRPPQGSPDADRWVVWLEGGGGCHTPEHVLAYYCSSDNWSGQARPVMVDASGQTPAYELVLHGAHLVDSLVDTLKDGATSDDGAVSLPSIDGASQVLFMGTSAGGGGARYNADHVAESLRSTNPDVDVRLVVDAGFHPKEPDPPEITEAMSEDWLQNAWEVTTEVRGARVDASCLSFHQEDPSICSDGTHTLAHHIQTPWYVKMDLSDNANSPGLYPDGQSFSRAVFDLVTSLRDRAPARARARPPERLDQRV